MAAESVETAIQRVVGDWRAEVHHHGDGAGTAACSRQPWASDSPSACRGSRASGQHVGSVLWNTDKDPTQREQRSTDVMITADIYHRIIRKGEITQG